jgi:hypothetical protein
MALIRTQEIGLSFLLIMLVVVTLQILINI